MRERRDKFFELSGIPRPYHSWWETEPPPYGGGFASSPFSKLAAQCAAWKERDRAREFLTQGAGMTLVGEPGSGKTYWGCYVLMSLLKVQPVEWRDGYASMRRLDYLELLEESFARNASEEPTLLQNLRQGEFIFLDNLCLRPPTPAIYSALLYRRDWGKSTFLAFQAENMHELAPELRRVWQAFEGSNETVLLDQTFVAEGKRPLPARSDP